VDGSGNTHYFIQLCPCMFHDGVSVTATDVKFTLLNFRDAPAAAYYGYVESVVSVNVLNPHLVEVVMQGQSVSDLYNLARVPIIPEHIWDSGDNFYGQGAGRVDPAKTSLAYDPIDSGTFIGSGPFVCKSMFAPDVGRIGGGCSENADGSRGNQAMLAGGTLLLSSFTQYATHPCVMPYFALSASPNTLTIRHTQSDKSTVTVSSVNGFTGAVTLSTVYPALTGLTVRLKLTSLSVPANGQATTTLIVSTTNRTPHPSSFTITIMATSSGLTVTTQVTVSVT